MVNWDSDTDLRLLMCCIDPATKPAWEKVADEMGPGFTTEAVRQRFAKLKKIALENSAAVAASGTPATPATPAKRNRAKNADGEGTPTKKPRGRKKANLETPVKKQEAKVEPIPGEAKEEPAKMGETA